jgi:hypothetical protein
MVSSGLTSGTSGNRKTSEGTVLKRKKARALLVVLRWASWPVRDACSGSKPNASWSLRIDGTRTPPYIETIKLMTRESRLIRTNAKGTGVVSWIHGGCQFPVNRLFIVAIGLSIVDFITPTKLKTSIVRIHLQECARGMMKYLP